MISFLRRTLLVFAALMPVMQMAHAAVHEKKLAVVYINPVNPANPSQRLMQALGWAAQEPMTPQVTSAINRATQGRVAYTVAASYTVDQFPARTDGQQWTWDSYIQCATAQPYRFPQGYCTPPGSGGYAALMNTMTGTNLCEKIRSGQIDEVWVWSPYYTGFDEFAWKTPGDRLYYTSRENNYWLYDGRRYDLPECGRPYFVMGFVSDAGIGNTLHSYGHRIESAVSLSAAGQGWFDACAINPDARNEWTDFVCYDQRKPAAAQCGNVHFPPNATQDYDYGNYRQVSSSCNDWLAYPNRTGATQLVNVQTWMQTGTAPFAGDAHASYMEWWLKHLPHADGSHKDSRGVTVANDWWFYILNYQDPYNALANQPPLANAGADRSTTPGSGVILDASASRDPDGSIVSYQWSNGGTGPLLYVSFSTPGDYTYTVTVTDNENASSTDTVVVHVAWNQVLPQVHLRGTFNGWAAGRLMTLVGNNQWELKDIVFGATTSERFKFDVYGNWSVNYGDTNRDGYADQGGADIPVTQGAGSYTIRFNDSTRQYSVVRQAGANRAPVANAGADFAVTGPVGTVTLDGTASSDPDGDALTYSWLQTAGRPVTLSAAATARPTFVLNAEPVGSSSVPYDTYEFKVTVSDGKGGTASDYVIVTHNRSTGKVTITFKPTVSTVTGQLVYVVGNQAALGNWNTSAAVPCTTTSATYPVWSCSGIQLAPGTAFEYKYIKRDGAGAVVWESGANRVRTVPASDAVYSETWK